MSQRRLRLSPSHSGSIHPFSHLAHPSHPHISTPNLFCISHDPLGATNFVVFNDSLLNPLRHRGSRNLSHLSPCESPCKKHFLFFDAVPSGSATLVIPWESPTPYPGESNQEKSSFNLSELNRWFQFIKSNKKSWIRFLRATLLFFFVLLCRSSFSVARIVGKNVFEKGSCSIGSCFLHWCCASYCSYFC